MKVISRFVVVAITALCSLITADAQVYNFRLKMADSLYQKKQYTQSLDLYNDIFKEHTYSPSMLLRMAYIEEGLGQNSKALYYISLYYELTHDQSALNKMEDMATKYNLTGYELSKSDHTLALINQYKTEIITVLTAICLVLISLMIYTVKKKKIKPYISFSFFILTAILLVAFINRNLVPLNGITQNAPAYLMSGPSPGAKVIGIVTEGHRLPINGRHDVWVRVKWRDGYAYLKENQVLEVKL